MSLADRILLYTWWSSRLIVGEVVIAQSLSCVQLFATPWTAARQAPLSSTLSQSLLKLTSTESVMVSNFLMLCIILRWRSTMYTGLRGYWVDYCIPAT